MSNTVITNFRDASGPRSSADSPFVVVLERDGTMSLDNAALEGLVGGDGSQSAGISVVRVAQDGKPDDATDSENEDESVPHVTLTVDGYYDDPNGIAKYDSGIEMLQSLSNETREHSLIGFQNDHCYTSLTSPSQSLPSQPASEISYDEIPAQAKHAIPSSKKITILEQQIIPKGKKIVFNPTKAPVILKGNDALSKPLPVISSKSNKKSAANKPNEKQTLQPNSGSEKTESSGGSTSGESVNDRDSDADYKCAGDGLAVKAKKPKSVLRGIRKIFPKNPIHPKPVVKVIPKPKQTKSLIRQDIKETLLNKKTKIQLEKKTPSILSRRKTEPSIRASLKIHKEPVKLEPKPEPPKPVKIVKKEKKTPAHMTALLSDMTSLFSTPDVIRRVSTDGKTKVEKGNKEAGTPEASDTDRPGAKQYVKTYTKNKERCVTEVKEMETIPQIDDASLARLLQEPTAISSGADTTTTTTTNPLSSPNLGPLSPSLDLLAGLQPEEEGLTEDLLMHVAQLVESSENLQEVIDKQVLGKVDPVLTKASTAPSTPVTAQTYAQAAANAKMKNAGPQKGLVQVIRSDGRVITLPPIEAPTTRSSKRKSQGPVQELEQIQDIPPVQTPEPVHLQSNPKQYSNKKIPTKSNEPVMVAAEPIKPAQVYEDSMNSEDDPYRLWCICKQPHNNRFMICCDRCEDWFHGKCVNITKSMGQQMEEQGVEWTCPNCIKKMHTPKSKSLANKKSADGVSRPIGPRVISESLGPTCIVCEKSARAGSIYCSDACILRHAQESLATSPGSTKSELADRGESRIIVFERKTGRVLQGIHAPTADKLKTWLQEHPTFEVVRRERENKPMVNVKKPVARPPQKIQTTLRVDKQPKQAIVIEAQPKLPQVDSKQAKSVPPSPQEVSPKTPMIAKRPQLKQTFLSAKDGTLVAKAITPLSKQIQQTPKQTTPMPKLVPVSPKTPDARKTPAKITLVRSQSVPDKSLKSPTTPVTRTRKEKEPETKSKPVSNEPIRENVRKAMQEHMTLRLAETKGVKFSEEEIKKFAYNTELEMHNLFKEVSMKYKAKYRSLIFNIKDRKNLSLWKKICDRSLTPKQLVRMSPEELASQELAQWRDKEAKYQLELIKKSELDLMAASKTYVLKTHKGEEVMEQKSVSAEVDPNVAVEDLVTALNDSAGPDDDLQKDDKHARQKESSKKSPHYDTPTRSSSRHKSSKEDRSRARKKNKEDKERSIDERRPRRDRHRSRNRVRDKSKHSDKDKRRSKSKDNSDSKARSRSRDRSRHRSRSRGRSRTRRRSRSKSKSSKRKSVSRDRQLRSLSQDNVYNSKDKYSYNDGEIERPKSAMQKESHPEYDPHEPMITSAFSEEDLRRSRETSFDEGYPEDVVVPGCSESEEYDPAKVLSFDADAPAVASSNRSDRVPSEVESDQEPTSTVDSAAPPVWNGLVNMVDVARFYVDAHQVSGNCADLEEDLTSELEIVGRINPDTVWDYIGKMKRTGNKDILVLRLVSSHSATVEERMQYIALYSYLSSRNRLGVVKVTNTSVKDFYMFPLAATASLPEVLLPLEGPGLDDVRTHLLFALIVRQKKKRSAATKIEASPAKAAKTSSRKRSYTPPVAKGSYTPPTSPARTRHGSTLRLPLPFVPPSPALSSSVKDKIAASLASAEEEEAYSPGGSSSGGSVAGAELGAGTDALRSRVDEINRQIEEHKQQILSIATTVSKEDDDEAYSPSRPMTPPRPALADIALPSNLHEILATIQQRSAPAPPPEDVDMRVPTQGHLHALSEEELLRMVPDDAH